MALGQISIILNVTLSSPFHDIKVNFATYKCRYFNSFLSASTVRHANNGTAMDLNFSAPVSFLLIEVLEVLILSTPSNLFC